MNEAKLEACNYAKYLACKVYKLTQEEIETRSRRGNIPHARFVAVALIRKYVKIPEEEIGKAFGCNLSRSHIVNSVKKVQGHIDLYNRKSLKTELFEAYQEAERSMKSKYRPRPYCRIPDVKL